VLVGVGRKPVTDDIGLETTRVETDRGFIKVDGDQQTAEPGLSALAASRLQTLALQEADALGEAGLEAFRRKRYAEAVATLEQAIRLAPEPSRKKEFQEQLNNMKVLIELRNRSGQRRD